jgi:hypothetical protein
MEFAMSKPISYAVLAAAVLGGASVANAQDVITQPLPPGAVVTRPVQTVQTVPIETVETVQTVRSVDRAARRPIGHHSARSRPESVVTTTTRRTILGERVLYAAPPVAAIAEPAYTDFAEPAYTDFAPPAVAAAPAYPPRLYDVATPPAAVVTEPVYGEPVAPGYRYVYEPDRILVIDPATGIAVQAIPR